MNHEIWKERVSALLDGELNEDERAQTLAHLDGCEACRTYLAELNALRDAFENMEDDDPPADFAAGVMARLHEDAGPVDARVGASAVAKPLSPTAHRSWRGWGALAACAAIIVLAVGILPNNILRVGSAAPESSQSLTMEAPMAAAEAPTASMDAAESESPEESAPAVGAEMFTARAADAENDAAPEAEPPRNAEIPAGGTADGGAMDATAKQNNVTVPYALELYTLSGNGADAWLAEYGTWDSDMHAFRVDTAALRELPEELTLLSGGRPLDTLPDEETLLVSAERTEALA